jgi:hypothetical protein
MDFNNVDARANLVEMYRKASGNPEGLSLADNAMRQFVAAEAASAQFAAMEALATQFLGISEANIGARAMGIAAEGTYDAPVTPE